MTHHFRLREKSYGLHFFFFFPSSISTFWVSISKSIYSCLISRTRSSGSLFCNLAFLSLYKLNRFPSFVGFYLFRKYY